MDLIEQQKIKSGLFQRHPWEQARLKIALYFLKKITAPKCIVDIGSGDAYISRNIAEQLSNVSVIAVDIHYSVQTISATPKPTNLLFLQRLGDFDRSDTVCSMVLMMDVIEHIAAPSELLKEVAAHPIITPETKFLITVPAYQMLFNQHDKMLGHYKRYSRTELLTLLNNNGYRVQQCGYFFASLLPVRILEKVLHKDVSPNSVAQWKGGKLLSALILNIFWLEFKIAQFLSRFKIYLPGLTCYCICYPAPL